MVYSQTLSSALAKYVTGSKDKYITEADKPVVKEERFHPSICDMNKIVKVNELQEVTNPVFFNRNSVPTPDGLLSNEIFGITKYDRSTTFAYIDLFEDFMHPLLYKIWSKLDSKVKECVHGIKTFKIDSKGYLVEDPDGESGIAFLKKNIGKINIPRTSSNKRDLNIQFFEKCRKDPASFCNKWIVLPAYYRDVNTDRGKIGVGEINELYKSLLISVRSLRSSSDYGLTLSDANRGRIQETILQIYNWFGAGTTINGNPTTNVIPGKTGIMRQAVFNKTTEYSSRLVISAPNLKVERFEDIEVDLDYTALPLASACANFFPFVLFHVRRFFENEFSGNGMVPILTKSNEVKYVKVKDYQSEFSDARIQKEIDRYIHGYSNRFIPIKVPYEDNGVVKYATMGFKGRNVTPEEYKEGSIGKNTMPDRALTWCDVFFIAATEAVEGKHVMTTRFPVDTCYNQFATRVRISSTKETEPMLLDGRYYPRYPKIRPEDILSNTSNKFVDTCQISNLYLGAIGGDYDGDQVSERGVYEDEANEELERFMKSKANYIDIGCSGLRNNSNEALMCIYSLTISLKEDRTKLGVPEF